MNKNQPIGKKLSNRTPLEKSRQGTNMESLRKQVTHFDYDDSYAEESDVEPEYPMPQINGKESALYSSLVILNEIANDLNGSLHSLDRRIDELTYQVGISEPSGKLDDGTEKQEKDSLNLNDIAKKFAKLATLARALNSDLSKIV